VSVWAHCSAQYGQWVSVMPPAQTPARAMTDDGRR
jgi:hypothetical protein